MTSLFKISEQCLVLLDKGAIQDYLASVTDAYSFLCKKEFYENKAEGVTEIDGAFVYTFPPITPEIDTTTDTYFITLPSSYLRLPYELGVVYIGFPKGQGFVRVTSGSASMYGGLASENMGGNQTYYTEGTKAFFPKMTSTSNGDIFCKLAIAYDNVDPDEQLNIPRSIITQIVDMVVAKYNPQPTNIKTKIE